MRHLLFAIVLAIGLTSCITKPTYITEVNMAEGATMNTEIVVDKPMDVKPATQLDLDLIPSI
jgi:starvation-inducible outer membrane lipoprotein